MPDFNKVLGDYLAVRNGLGPVAGTGSAQPGPWIDRTGFGSMLAIVQVAFAGGATGGNVTILVRDATSAAGAAAADYLSAVTRSAPAGTNQSFAEKLSVDLNGARQFIQVTVTAAPTGGTPTSMVGVVCVLGNSDRLPAV